MAFFTARTVDDFLAQLQVELGKQMGHEPSIDLQQFSQRFFSIVPLDELLTRRLSDLAGCTLSAWHLLETPRLAPCVQVFNPSYEQQGWQSPHTVVQVLVLDSPFLVDSLRMALTRHGLGIHSLQSVVLPVRHSSTDQPLEAMYALIYFEVDRCAMNAELAALEQELLQVLAEVQLAVADYPALCAKAQNLLDNLLSQPSAASAVAEDELNEARAFLSYLLDHHFTFLGYEYFVLQEDSEGVRQHFDTQQSLGLARLTQPSQEPVPEAVADYLKRPLLLSFAKSSRPGRVHRLAYPDYVSIRELDAQGQVVGEHRFSGLYTSAVYSQSVWQIPYVRGKVAQIVARSGFDRKAHLGKELEQVLEVLPRDELFQTPLDELFATAMAIVKIQERNKLKLFIRHDPYGCFVYGLIYVPRERYSSETRQNIQNLLMERLGASDCEFWTYFSESALARVQLILKVDPKNAQHPDPLALEQEAIAVCRTWQDDFAERLIESMGEAQATQWQADFPKGFPAGYRERFSAASAVVDAQHCLDLTAQRPLALNFYQEPWGAEYAVHAKLYRLGEPLALSDVLPVLEHLGLRVLSEFSCSVQRHDGLSFWLHDFSLSLTQSASLTPSQLNSLLQEAFLAVSESRAENDSFNKLVLAAALPWDEVAVLRGFAHYLKQIRLGFDLGYIANTLLNHAALCQELMRLFAVRFQPQLAECATTRQDQQEACQKRILAELDKVSVLSEDRILRHYLQLIMACMRTNFYQTDAQGRRHEYFSFKFAPRLISELPKPVPKYEIFVYSPQVEGVHLRFAEVARGGLRWSDREEDYRTEVLGLVKAQQVKNAVIVPLGAKGGFVPKRLPQGGSREALQAEAQASYRTFIRGLLDVTDNLQAAQVMPPPHVLRYDQDDPYLVVAADKGTAGFSDIANALAFDYQFWLGDAFASGGSAGYSHKGMAITARGGWVSVQRHFRELGVDVQREPITVLGIGDMAGDVFGNGLLRSEALLLVAAFNHQHIFIDPNPEPARSFAERKRLFELPRSSWADYASELISQGGGVFLRSAKNIRVSPQMRERFALEAEQLTPNELIQALLKAPLDLLWNGGIGTYVKARRESHADVGDKANDALRINGCELRVKVVGEGGNLGMTQWARVEYALAGGLCNTDFIDNAGGVSCSDQEVNIKILLNALMAAGDLTLKQRNQLLAEMTEQVAELVLASNYQQAQALSLAQRRSRERLPEYRRVIAALESSGRLDRALEFLPTDEALNERAAQGQSLTRPELAVLLAYGKIDLKSALLKSALADEPYVLAELHKALPAHLSERFGAQLERHPLRRELICTQLANDLFNHMGISFVQRLEEATGLGAAAVVGAYVIVRDVFGLDRLWHSIEALDGLVSADLQLTLQDELMRLGRRACRWFLRGRREGLAIDVAVEHFAPRLSELCQSLEHLLNGPSLAAWQERRSQLLAAGVPAELAHWLADCGHLYTLLLIIEAADASGCSPAQVASVYLAVGEALELPWYLQQITELEVHSTWQALAREALRDELNWQQRSMTIAVLSQAGEADALQALEQWLAQRAGLVKRWRGMLTELKASSVSDYAMYSVAGRELGDLAQSAAQL